MSDNMLIALITVGGMLGASVITASIQVLIQKRILVNEYKKIAVATHAESNVRSFEKKREALTNYVSELLTLTDPEISRRMEF